MTTVHDAATAELAALPAALRTSALAATLLELASRLDSGPTDREAAQLARELRLGLADLRVQAAAVPREGGIDVSAAEMGD